MKKKSLVWGIVIFLAILVLVILFIKNYYAADEIKINGANLAQEAKANVFSPSSLPTVSVNEKIVGSIKAPVKILVYEDYAAIFSADLAKTLERVQADYSNDIVIAFRPFALRNNPASLEMAMAIECASENGGWVEMRQAIFNAVQASDLSYEKISMQADKQGLDKDKFAQCLTSTEKQGIMLKVAEDAKNFSVYGAPTIFINDELIIGARPYDDYLDENGEMIKGLKSLVAKHLQ